MNFLEEIVNIKKEEVISLKRNGGTSIFTDNENFHKPCLSLAGSIKNSQGFGIIGEIKKASPSKGILRNNFNPIEIAEQYYSAGVNGLSILTDKNFFKGDIEFLEAVAKTKQVPILRKDFIIDEIQVYQAKAAGADAILLICEILSEDKIVELASIAKKLGMEILLELHNPKELEKIDFKTVDLIGINNRNLETFEVDLNTSLNIIDTLPKETIKISESGISSLESLNIIKNAGFDGALIGEFFMRSKNISSSLNEIRGMA